MKYETLLDELIQEIPHLKELFDEAKDKNIIDNTIGNHVIFGIIFVPYITSLLDESGKIQDKKLNDIFEFFEKMALSNDEDIKELLMYTILEVLGDDTHILEKSHKYMRSETRNLSNKVEHFLGRSNQ